MEAIFIHFSCLLILNSSCLFDVAAFNTETSSFVADDMSAMILFSSSAFLVSNKSVNNPGATDDRTPLAVPCCFLAAVHYYSRVYGGQNTLHTGMSEERGRPDRRIRTDRRKYDRQTESKQTDADGTGRRNRIKTRRRQKSDKATTSGGYGQAKTQTKRPPNNNDHNSQSSKTTNN